MELPTSIPFLVPRGVVIFVLVRRLARARRREYDKYAASRAGELLGLETGLGLSELQPSPGLREHPGPVGKGRNKDPSSRAGAATPVTDLLMLRSGPTPRLGGLPSGRLRAGFETEVYKERNAPLPTTVGEAPEALEARSKYHVAPPMSGASDVESEFDVVSLQLEGASELGLRFLLAPADIESELVVSSDVLSATLEG